MNDNKNLPLVTVGIPVFNGEAYLTEAIESVVAQDYANLEIIISDNHSTDQTPAICNRFKKNYPQITCISPSKKISGLANFYYTLDSANGEYFMWASYDDLRETNYIRKLVNILVRNKDIMSAFSIFNEIDEGGMNIKKNYTLDYSCKIRELRLAKYWLFIPNYRDVCLYGLFRKNALQKIPRLNFKWTELNNQKRIANLIITGMLSKGNYSVTNETLFHRRKVNKKPRLDDIKHDHTRFIREILVIIREAEVRYLSLKIMFITIRPRINLLFLIPVMLLSFVLFLAARYYRYFRSFRPH